MLIDFGLAEKYIPGKGLSGFCGSIGCFAPEMAKGNLYNEKVDIFSIGVICYQMLSGSSPFGGRTASETIE
jgi:serine/threonine protein kinase